MKLVVIESPYSAATHSEVEHNLRYARACMSDSLHRGEAPIASHLLYTQPGILDDTIKEERQLGMNAGFAWNKHANFVAVYTDLGFSDGMLEGIRVANLYRIPIQYRAIGFKRYEHPYRL